MKSPKSLVVGIAAALALVSGSLVAGPASPVWAADPITIEGESPTSSNLTPGVATQAGASGGSSLQLYTGTEAPTGGYVASYTVTAPEASLYQLDATTIPIGVTWASPYSFSVNGGAWRSTSGATQLAVVNSELRTYTLGAVSLAEGSNTISFRVNQRRTTPNTHYAVFLDKFVLTPVPITVSAVNVPDRFGVFEEGEQAELTAFLNAEAPAATPVTWEVTDYWGDAVDSDQASAALGQASVTIPLGDDLPTGAYRVTASVPGQAEPTQGAFSVLPEYSSRAAIDDSPFAVDVYGSKLIAADDAEAFAHVLKLTGVDWIRDRQRWNDTINPSAGVIDFSGEQQARTWLEAADAAGLKTMSSFHDGPAWTRTSTRELPQDLRDLYAFSVAAGEEYDGVVDAWQLWNEQNRKFALDAEGADRYASALKASALGFLDSGTDAQLVSGGLAGVDPHYAQWQFRNGILDFIDSYAYHTHTTGNPAATVNNHPDIDSQLEAAAPYGGDAKGRWVSESGVALNLPDASRLPTAQQEILQARYLVTSAAQSLAAGSTKQFFFIAAPYREGVTYWSTYRTPDEPMAALAAQSIMTQQLGQGDYLGALPGLPAGASGYAFDSGAGTTAVLWAAEPTSVTVPLTSGTATAADLMGGELPVTVSGTSATIAIGPDPVYVSVDGITGLVDAPTAVQPAAPVSAGDFSDAERVVLQQVFTEQASAASQTSGYALSTTASNAVTVEAYNFNDHAVTATIAGSAEGGWQVGGGSPSVTIPAGGRSTASFTIGAGTDLRHSLSDLTFVATVGGQESSPSVAELRPSNPSLTATHAIVDDEDVLRAKYTNRTSSSQQIVSSEWTFDGDSETVAQSITVAAGATVTVDSPAAPAGEGELAYEATLSFAGGGSASTTGTIATTPWAEVPHIAERTIVVDGVLDDLTGVAEQKLSAPGADEASIDATAWFTWDDDNLYLSTVVEDDEHIQPYTGNAIWQADSLQFAVSPNWPGETDLRPEVQPRIEFGFALTPQGSQLYRFASGSVAGTPVTGTPFAAVRDDVAGTTTYEAAVPWSLLAPIGATPESAASLAITANDTDTSSDGIRGWVSWFGEGITTAKDSELFSPVLFEKE